VVFSLDHAGLGVHDPRRVGMRTLERVVRSMGNYKDTTGAIVAGGVLRTSTRPTMNVPPSSSARLYEYSP